MKKCGRGICLQVKSFINLLRELSVNWGDRSSGEPEQHQLDEESPVNAEAVRGQQVIQISRCMEFFLFLSPKTWWRTFRSNNQIQIFRFPILMKMKASDDVTQNPVKLSARAQSNFRNFTPIWGRRKIQEDGRWRRRGSHANLHIFNHCHLAKYCDVWSYSCLLPHLLYYSKH